MVSSRVTLWGGLHYQRGFPEKNQSFFGLVFHGKLGRSGCKIAIPFNKKNNQMRTGEMFVKLLW